MTPGGLMDMKMHVRCGIFAAALLVLVPASAGAQVPNSGAIARQTQQTQSEAARRTSPTDPTSGGLIAPQAPPPIVVPGGGATFLLRDVDFSPSELLPAEDLKAISAKYVGKQVDLAALQAIANAVNELYADRGFVTASAVLPQQDLATGVLRVQLIEGRVGKVGVAGRQTLDAGLLDRAVPLEGGSTVRAPELSRAVDRFNRTSSAQIQASLQPGVGFGLTDINLAVIEPKRNRLDLFVDNLGVDSVGLYEGGVIFQHYGLLGIDDRFTGYGLLAEGNAFGSAAYNFAASPFGTRLGASYSRSTIHIIEGPFEILDVDGAAEIVSANLAQPLYSRGPFLVLGNLAGSYGTSSTEQSGFTITDDETKKLTLGFAANYFGQRVNASLSPSVSFADAALNVTGEDISYQLYQITGDASFLVTDNLLLSARGTGQLSSERLLPGSDLFQIGGPATVRGYPSSALSGDSGYFVNVELSRNIAKGLDGFVFVDNGTVYSEFPSSQSLTSAGFGVNYNWNDRLRAEVSIGIPLLEDKVPEQGFATVYARLVATIF
jgi:hemolysin activation/secretion protein